MPMLMSLNEFLDALNSKTNNLPSGLRLYLAGSSRTDDKYVTKIADALTSGNCPSDLNLDLGGSNIGDEGATKIAEALALRKCPSGLNLNLRGNYIRVAGATKIAEALASGNCPSGLNLNLGGNQIGNEGITKIAAALASSNCPSGLNLNLESNYISDEGVTEIVAALASGNCPSGLNLNLTNNNISDAGATKIAEALRSNRCPLGTKIIGLGIEIERLCEENDKKIIRRSTCLIADLIWLNHPTDDSDPNLHRFERTVGFQLLALLAPSATAEYFERRTISSNPHATFQPPPISTQEDRDCLKPCAIQ